MRSVEQQITRLFLCHIAVGIGLASIFTALGMIGWDVVVWWRDGTWKALNFFDLLILFPGLGRLSSISTINKPELHSAAVLLGSVPVEAVAVILGWIIMRRSFNASDKAGRRLDLLRRLEAR